ncbi:MAG: pyridoxine 5'-phosphate synthase [Elusimicrobia bacterium CG08_land_8_20_14_0_20_44_26]|nr:MAG: pyridoxine 5'-phosphate synthase [Elusimicrobia bacterium CG08_land_8_20_14_0_20_44_26]
MVKLGVNIDHIASIRQSRFTKYPDPVKAAASCEKGGADGITIHLREDRRHIQDADCILLRKKIKTKLNLEMSLNPGIISFAKKLRPDDVCIVPEKRKELTTEGGLNVFKYEKTLLKVIPALHKNGIRVSIFIEPNEKNIVLSKKLGADCVELHTGKYAVSRGEAKRKELLRIKSVSKKVLDLGLILNAGHGLHYGNTLKIAQIPGMNELNIGHSIIARAVFVGLEEAVREMKKLLV